MRKITEQQRRASDMYGFKTSIDGKFDDVLPRVTEELKKEGFGILSDIDVQATQKDKLGIDSPRYRILGACNPPYAHRALEADADLGLLLPCNVVVREADGGTVIVGFMDPEAVLDIVDNAQVSEIGKEIRAKLQRVRDALGGAAA
jgi:uncharacterized protein (DUF302 family)